MVDTQPLDTEPLPRAKSTEPSTTRLSRKSVDRAFAFHPIAQPRKQVKMLYWSDPARKN